MKQLALFYTQLCPADVFVSVQDAPQPLLSNCHSQYSITVLIR